MTPSDPVPASADSGAVAPGPEATTEWRRQLRRVLISSTAGTSIEWYDFFLFGSAAALVFPRVFFPESDPATGILLSFGTYAVAFVARPLGGFLFGRLGDRAGRKAALVATLLLTGIGTFLMGVLPGYQSIGLFAPLLLVVLRLLQGLGLGGEWGGAVTLAAEFTDAAGHARRRGLFASWPQLGVPIGNLFAVGALAAAGSLLPPEDFLTWGWRVPFLASALLVLIGLWIRLRVSESPLFVAAQQRQRQQTAPLTELWRTARRPILITIGLRIASDVSYYVFAVFGLAYLATNLELPRQWGLYGVLVGSVAQLVVIPVAAAYSDRLGRRGVYAAGAAAVGIWAIVAWPLLELRTASAVVVAIAVGIAAQGVMYGPMAAFVAELFPTRIRCSGTSVGYQTAGVFGGALAPIIAQLLVTWSGSTVPVIGYVVATAALAAASALLATETVNRHLDDTSAPPAAAPVPRTSP